MRETVGTVFFDIHRVIDSVWHRELIHKMIVTGINPSMIVLIQTYVSCRSFCNKFKTNFTYLGIRFNQKHTWKKHIDEIKVGFLAASK